MINAQPPVGLIRRGGGFRGRGGFWGRGRHFGPVVIRHGAPYYYGPRYYPPYYQRSVPCPTNIQLSSRDVEALARGETVRLVGANQCGQAVQVTIQGAQEPVSGVGHLHSMEHDSGYGGPVLDAEVVGSMGEAQYDPYSEE